MPELPEVETVARQLNQSCKESKIVDILILDKKLSVNQKIISLKINRIFRAGKYILFELSKAKSNLKLYLSIHLRMSGRLFVIKNKKIQVPKYTRLQLILNSGSIFFSDARRFGTVRVVKSLDELSIKGIDPLSKDFTYQEFLNLLGSSKQNIKQWLIRQDRIVGIGNIYACEILFRSSINPWAKVNSLSIIEKKLLYKNIKVVLNKAVKLCGTTFSDFQDAHGVTGKFQKFLFVYDRTSKPCIKCKTKIIRKRQNGRGTYFCPVCQRLKD